MTDLGSVRDVLTDAQRLGFLGPEPVDRHIDHATAWSEALTPATFLDLGSGGGVPGLILAAGWPGCSGVLLDGQLRRTAWLRSAVVRLGFHPRIQVVEGRAERLGHSPEHREQYPIVVARAFGPPGPAAECGAAFVRVGGILSISEPPESDPARWPSESLGHLGLGPPSRVTREGAGFVILPKSSKLPDTYPRYRNLPWKSPLW